MVAECLKTKADDIASAITTRSTLTRGEAFITPLTIQKVMDLKKIITNEICKFILFYFIEKN